MFSLYRGVYVVCSNCRLLQYRRRLLARDAGEDDEKTGEEREEWGQGGRRALGQKSAGIGLCLRRDSTTRFAWALRPGGVKGGGPDAVSRRRRRLPGSRLVRVLTPAYAGSELILAAIAGLVPWAIICRPPARAFGRALRAGHSSCIHNPVQVLPITTSYGIGSGHEQPARLVPCLPLLSARGHLAFIRPATTAHLLPFAGARRCSLPRSGGAPRGLTHAGRTRATL
jgi:hypothetical protein